MNNFQKPESALRRAHELYANGNKQIAIETLHGVMTSRKNKTWTPTHESMMKLFIKIAVDMRRTSHVKDGLHMYRSITQFTAPQSLSNIVVYFLDTVEERCQEAVSKSNFKMTSAQDLDEVNAAETIMLSSVTTEGDKDRVEREMLVPWLRFLHDGYRVVLDIVRNNNKLEQLYHQTCERSFNFCVKHERKQELRRLKDFILKHLRDLERWSSPEQLAGDNRKNATYQLMLSTDVYESHLKTRFKLLNAAVKLQMLQVAYKTIEDIHRIMGLIDVASKEDYFTEYYQRLTEMFLVSKDYLFHAYAWLKLYNLQRTSSERADDAAMENMASCLTLASMAVPVFSMGDNISNIDQLEAHKAKEMAGLLGYHFSPERSSLMEQLSTMNLLDMCAPQIRTLFHILENGQRPISMVKEVVPIIAWLRGNETFMKYADGIDVLLVVRLLEQLAKIYKSMTMEKFKTVLAGSNLKFHEVEQILLQAIRARHLNVRFDHQNKCLRFDSDTMETTQMRSQLILLSRNLRKVVCCIEGGNATGFDKNRYRDFIEGVLESRETVNTDTVARKHEVERMKQLQEKRILEDAKKAADKAKQDKLDAIAKAKAAAAAAKKKADEDKAKRMAIIAARDAKRKAIKDAGLEIAENKLDNMTVEEIIQMQRDQAVKEHRKEAAKLREQNKKVDYLCRALRDEERPLLLNHVKQTKEKETLYFRNKDDERLKKDRLDWETQNAQRKNLSAASSVLGEYEAFLFAIREKKLEADREKATLYVQLEKRRRKLERARRFMLEKEAAERERRRVFQEREEKEREAREWRERSEQEEQGGGRWQKREYGSRR
jgi:translation initiation factor 3 subunit A